MVPDSHNGGGRRRKEKEEQAKEWRKGRKDCVKEVESLEIKYALKTTSDGNDVPEVN